MAEKYGWNEIDPIFDPLVWNTSRCTNGFTARRWIRMRRCMYSFAEFAHHRDVSATPATPATWGVSTSSQLLASSALVLTKVLMNHSM